MKGSSLPETIVALGLLAAVVLSTAGLISTVSRRVAGAGRSSRALAACGSVLELLESRGFVRSWRSLGCDGGAPACAVDSADAAVFPWRSVLEAAPSGCRAEVTFEALDGPSLGGARAIRITVVVRWREGARGRKVRLVTIRT